MTTKIPDIKVADRDMSVNPRKLRREGRLPATVYGRKMEPVCIDLDKRSFTHLYNSQVLHLVTLEKNEEKLRALVKNIQVDPISNEILNIEFLRISEDEKVTLSVPLQLEGEAPAFKKGATMLQLMDTLEVQCLPRYIPDVLPVDMSSIEDVDVTITVGDINYPEGIEPVLAKDTPVLRISPPRGVSEEEEAAEAAEGEEQASQLAGAEA